jgi:hypothetical protein
MQHTIADPAIVRTLLPNSVGMLVDCDELWQIAIADVLRVLVAVDGPVCDLNAI